MTRNFSNLICLFFMAAMLSSCRHDAQSPEEKAEYWRQELPRQVPVGAHQDELTQWLESHGIEYSAIEKESILLNGKSGVFFIAEELEGDGWVCSKWSIHVTAEIDQEGLINRYDVMTLGTCL